MTVSFSRYEIGPPGDQELRRRTSFDVSLVDVTEGWLRRELSHLRADEELALHSRLEWRGDRYHIPMIDYEAACPLPTVIDLGTKAIAETHFAGDVGSPALYTYHSGGSYHQYSDGLIGESDWAYHLGSLLLLNAPAARPVVDVRWLGHALRRGYAALRWSWNTSRYTAMPQLVGSPVAPPVLRDPQGAST